MPGWLVSREVQKHAHFATHLGAMEGYRRQKVEFEWLSCTHG